MLHSWQFVRKHRIITGVPFAALGIFEMFYGGHPHRLDDYWFGGLWIVVGLLTFFNARRIST